MDFKLQISFVEKIKEYNGLTDIISSIHWTYMCIDHTDTYKKLRTLRGVTHMDLPAAESFTPIEQVDYNILNNWLTSVVDFDALKEKLKFMLTIEMQPVSSSMIAGTNALNQ